MSNVVQAKQFPNFIVTFWCVTDALIAQVVIFVIAHVGKLQNTGGIPRLYRNCSIKDVYCDD